MRDDTIKVEISKKDLTTMEELPGADLTITDKDGKEIDRWVSTDTPHYIEKLPAGDYTLTEVKAPDGYAFADYVSACKARALYDTGISAQYGDKLLTLSTCDNLTDNGRLLVIAKRIEAE